MTDHSKLIERLDLYGDCAFPRSKRRMLCVEAAAALRGLHELSKDAARYRWVRAFERTQTAEPWLVSQGAEMRKTIWWEAGLDAAIDAAMEPK